MPKRVSPIAWRASRFQNNPTVWGGNFSSYARNCYRSIRIDRALEKIVPSTTGSEIRITEEMIHIKSSIPSIEHVAKSNSLPKLNSVIFRTLNIKPSIDFLILKKHQVSAGLIAHELAQLIKNRLPISASAAHWMGANELDRTIKGLKIEVKGRFKPSARKQRARYAFGSVPVQSISANIEYVAKDVVGKYGKSTVRVWIHRDDRGQ